MVASIKVEKYIEHENGSATVVFECDDEAKKLLINEGLIHLIEKTIDKENTEYDSFEGLPKEDESA